MIDDLPIPPAWAAAAHDWAPSVLAALLVTTALARLALPVARRIELWAITTPAAWDDGPARRLVEVLEWLVSATSAILAWLPRLTMGPRPAGTSAAAREHRRDTRPPTAPPGAGAALLLLALALSPLLQGCGASAVAIHARAATATAGTLAAAGTVVDEARRQALDRVEAEHPTDPEHDEALLAEAARWDPIGAAFDTARAAQLAWVASTQAAYLAGGGDDLLGSLLPVAARAILLYAEVMRLAGSLGAELPELPAYVLGLGAALGGGR